MLLDTDLAGCVDGDCRLTMEVGGNEDLAFDFPLCGLRGEGHLQLVNLLGFRSLLEVHIEIIRLDSLDGEGFLPLRIKI